MWSSVEWSVRIYTYIYLSEWLADHEGFNHYNVNRNIVSFSVHE